MREMVEFRITEDEAVKYLPKGLGTDLGGTRKVIVNRTDPLFERIGEIQREFLAEGKHFFLYSNQERYYTKRELEEAKLFQVWSKRIFEPEGEGCGTKYDESTACPECGAGAKQVGDLRLDFRKIPKTADFAETIADEKIISERFAEWLADSGLTGFGLGTVRHKARYQDDAIDYRKIPAGREVIRKAEAKGISYDSGDFDMWQNRPENRMMVDKAWREYVESKRLQEGKRPGKPFPVWYQLIVTSPPVDIVPPTRAGDDVFGEDDYGKCSRGDTLGLNLLSELTVAKDSLPDADVMTTRQFVGVRRGVLRPRQLLLMSPRARQMILGAGFKGFKFEVVHVA
jgi:hypothetical protein